MSKFSDFSYSPYTNSTNSQFNPALYNNKGANAGCVGTKNMAGGSNITTSSFYGLKSVDADTASTMRGSYAPVTIQSHSQCAGSRKRRSKKGTKKSRKYVRKTCGMCKCCKCKCSTCRVSKTSRKSCNCKCCKCKCAKCRRSKTSRKRCSLKCKCAKCRSNKSKKTRRRRRTVKRIKMKGGSALSNASYTTLTKLSPTESMMASPIPFAKTETCVDNYNHFKA